MIASEAQPPPGMWLSLHKAQYRRESQRPMVQKGQRPGDSVSSCGKETQGKRV